MQIGTSTIPLLPAVAVGAAVVLAVLVFWGVSRARRVPGATPSARDAGAETGPCAEDWTGEAAGGAADPPPARSATVAEAVAARRADTRPFPSVPDAADHARGPWVGTAPDDELVAAGSEAGDRGTGPAGPGPDTSDPGASDEESEGSPAEGGRVPRHGVPRVTPDEGGAGDDGDLAGADERGRTSPRHAYAPEPATTVAARPVHDPWAAPAEPDPWAAPAAPDPYADLAASDSTADLPAPGPPAPVSDLAPAPGAEPPSSAVTESSDAVRSGEDRIEPGRPDDASAEPGVDACAVTGSTAEPMPRPEHADDPSGGAGRDASPEMPRAGDGPETVQDTEGLDHVDPIGALAPGPVPPPWSAARSGPDAARSADADADADADTDADAAAPISVAVAQALAAREMQRARGVPPEDAVGSEEPPSVPDARDRLLSVLLSDPVAALGAAIELDDTRVRIDQLGDVLRRRRADLATAVHRLHASGLTGEQIGRLSGLDGNDVRAILERRAEEGASER